MIAIIIISVVLTLGYLALMLVYRKGWKEQLVFEIPDDYLPRTPISVIIPARDEAKNIGACINAILANKYPQHLLEIIVVDDHSTDDTAAIVKAYQRADVKCISLAEHVNADDEIVAYKKKALDTGIHQSKGELIVTTDADCIAPPNWLQHIAAMYEQQNPVMIVAPVDYSNNNTLLQIFQSLDFMSMQGITGAAMQLNLGNMSNGANLAFTKKAYLGVGGYDGIDHLASGDDYLLMVKMNYAFPARTSYLKSTKAIVRTAPQLTWRSFLMQRIRWASKSGKYDDKRLTAILVFVYLFNLALVALLVGSFFNIYCIIPFAYMLILKTEVELIYLYPVARFFGKRSQLVFFPLLQPLHILYIIVAGFLGFAGKYEWKGRSVR